ncbi:MULTISPECIES: hypothetical protein [Pseudomonas]|jgi:hypothetical protein|uniref:Uncharacterized protein n=1 Tax=Pseudomonas fluorescens TaxID=294 RepID=A0A7M2J3C7_PSEFL|nr:MULTISPECIES: hypothetical protein [Pseudomonas]MBL1311167.1 hypothetical protein [Pseudomonas sp.]MDR6578644.1 hypothetical protein [Pseudomonas extremaustralis]QOU04095.1 hypothetical protein IM720_25880 [Pseudomonas fluorescens]WEX14777.1 hypothetical protein P2T68_29920 [Pseudomonas sp. G11]WLD66343.1 hypothetical protein QU606_29055 [Pseudomonas sp. OVF7]
MTHLCLKEIRQVPTHRGEPVTFCAGTGFLYHRTDVMRGRQDQTKGRKKPVLMRFLQGSNDFHEKMTFSYRFGRACCIHTHIVGNDTRSEAGVSRKEQQRFNANQGRLQTIEGFENSIEVVSPVTFGL